MRVLRVGIDTPEVRLSEGNGHLPSHQLSVLRAMRMAVALATPGDVVVQRDMEACGPLPEPMPLQAGCITILDTPVSPNHVCPRAFVLPDSVTRTRLLALWGDETLRSCHGWAGIQKVQGPAVYHHPYRPPRRVREAHHES